MPLSLPLKLNKNRKINDFFLWQNTKTSILHFGADPCLVGCGLTRDCENVACAARQLHHARGRHMVFGGWQAVKHVEYNNKNI